MKRLLIFFSLLLTSCSSSYLTVYTDYFNDTNLASYYVNTPDPLSDPPPVGQRLIITWMLSKEYRSIENLQLQVTMRFRNHEEISETVDLTDLKGTYVYPLLGEDYVEKRGFLCYKADLVSSGGVIEEWRHQMWTEAINLP